MAVIVVLVLAWILLYVGSRGVGFGEGKNAHGLSGDNEWYYQENGHGHEQHGHEQHGHDSADHGHGHH